MTLTPNTRLGPYEILAPLGAGGMGEVWLALDTKLERKVALKLLPAEFTKDPDRVRRFEQEAKAVSALNHPHIITIHEIGEAEAGRFIVIASRENCCSARWQPKLKSSCVSIRPLGSPSGSRRNLWNCAP